MLERIVASLGGKHDIERLQALCAQLVRDNDKLRLENAKLRAENRDLRRRLAERELTQLRRAEADAALIGGLLFAQLPTTRDACMEYGISRRRWAWAMALLKVALVRRHDGGWRDVDMAEFESRLRGAVGIVERDGLQTLVDRMPRNGWSGEHRTNPRRGRGATPQSHAESHAPSHASVPGRDQYTSSTVTRVSARAGRYDLIPAAQ